MPNDLIVGLIGTVFGAVLTQAGNWSLIYKQKKLEINDKKKLFTKAIIHNLEASIPLYALIKNDWEKTSEIWFEHTIELKQRRKIFNNYLENVLLYPEELGKKIFDYYIKTDRLISLLEELENRKQFLLNQYISTLDSIKKTNPDIDESNARQQALSLLQKEDTEFQRIKALLADKVKDLSDFSNSATGILKELKSIC